MKIIQWIVIALGISVAKQVESATPLFFTKEGKRHLTEAEGEAQSLPEQFSPVFPESTLVDVTLNPEALELLKMGISAYTTSLDAEEITIFSDTDEVVTSGVARKQSKKHKFKIKHKSTAGNASSPEGRHLRGSVAQEEFTSFTLESENGGTAILSVGPNGISAVIREMDEDGISGQTIIVSPADSVQANLAHVVTMLSKADEQRISALDKADHEKHLTEAPSASQHEDEAEEGHHRALATTGADTRKKFFMRINYDNDAVKALRAESKTPRLTDQQLIDNNANLQMAQLQFVLANSDVDYQIVLEKAVHVDRGMTHDSYADLSAVSTMPRGTAHFTMLITGSNGYCGRSYLPGKTDGFSAEAFKVKLSSVVSLMCSIVNWTFVHEWGHAVNADHNKVAAYLRALFPYSYGYISEDRTKGTIMSYIVSTIYRYATFSKRGTYQGITVGDAKTDNARTIAESLYDYANLFFGGTGTSAPPTAAPIATNVPTPFVTTKYPTTHAPTAPVPTKQPTKPILTTRRPTFAPTNQPTIDQTPKLFNDQYVRFTVQPAKLQTIISINLIPNRLVKISNTGIIVLNTASGKKPLDRPNVLLPANVAQLLSSIKLTAGSRTRLQFSNDNGYISIYLVPQKRVIKKVHGKKQKVWVDQIPQLLVQVKQTSISGGFSNPTISFIGLTANKEVIADPIYKIAGAIGGRRLDEVPPGDLTDEERKDIIEELASSPYAMLHVLNINSEATVEKLVEESGSDHNTFFKQLFAAASDNTLAELFKVIPPEEHNKYIQYIHESRYSELAEYAVLKNIIHHDSHRKV